MPLADINFGELLLLVFEIFVFMVWFWILFRSSPTSSATIECPAEVKAVWVLLLIFIPFLTGLVYLIVRGKGMAERNVKDHADAKREFDGYVREQAHASPADEVAKLQGLREKGALTDVEFQTAKQRLLA